MVDAAVSKTVGRLLPCRFESDLRHYNAAADRGKAIKNRKCDRNSGRQEEDFGR